MAYCSVDDLRAFGYNIQDSDIEKLETICDIASAKVESYSHQSFKETKGAIEKHLIRIKDGIAKIFPRNLTVNTVNTITFFTVSKTPIPYVIENPIYMPNGAVIVASTNAPMGEYFAELYEGIVRYMAKKYALVMKDRADKEKYNEALKYIFAFNNKH